MISMLQKLMFMILAIIPNWIITMPIFQQFLKTKVEQVVHKKEFKNMVLASESLFKLKDMAIGDEKPLPKGLQRELMPRHIGVILDGNRRWAKMRGRITVEGYEAGLANLGMFLSLCRGWNIPIVSLFMFSTENWDRPQEEVDFLIDLFEGTFKHYLLRNCRRFGGRVSVIGDTSKFPNSLQNAIKQIEEDTRDFTEIHLIMAMSYSGQNDIVHACQNIAMKVKDGLLQPEDITKSLFEQQLQTMVTHVPSPDLLIRTSGEIRISNYYLWQSAYTEMYFTDTLWPDFGEDEFVKALRSFQQRGRRYGKI
ncbi:Dehydrodolichyl diphosphate synthase 4 [Bienertia sinuspersici]